MGWGGVQIHTLSTLTSDVGYLRRCTRGSLGVGGVGWGIHVYVQVHTSSSLMSDVRSHQIQVGKWPRRFVANRHVFATTDEPRRGEPNLPFADRNVLKTETL